MFVLFIATGCWLSLGDRTVSSFRRSCCWGVVHNCRDDGNRIGVVDSGLSLHSNFLRGLDREAVSLLPVCYTLVIAYAMVYP